MESTTSQPTANNQNPRGKLFVVGFGPGSHDHLTFKAKEVITSSEVVVGYETYIELVKELTAGKEVIRSGMQEELERAKKAIELATKGKRVALISSGDAGVYGMAGLVYEVLHQRGWTREKGDIDVEVIPGITAANSVAAILGAPLTSDFAVISLSDLLTPWEVIMRRIEAAVQGDLVIVLYNPKSGRRTQQIVETQKILLRYRKPSTPVGIVKSAFREGQRVILTDLEHMLDHDIGMLTTIIVGNSATYTFDGLMINPRGYERKYVID